MALASTTKEAIFLRKLTKELRLRNWKHPIKIYCNNKRAINLSKNSMFHAQTKHIDVQHYFICEAILTQKTEIIKINEDCFLRQACIL